MRRLLRGQKGDTIVEVLIAIAVISSVLAIAYSIMNRNLKTMRENQERSESVKQAQQQVEALKYLWGTATNQATITSPSVDQFCVGTDNITIVPLLGTAPDPSLAADNFANYPAACIRGLYRVGITRTGTAGNYVFKVYVRWLKLGRRTAADNGRNQSTLVYRLD